ncbi:MAG: Gfo/Idh/MocA family oxidoreductase [Opitutaceae bacterium]|nr:Gfo/Idh/MocA family oxidoreductase [Opitutaceae bacterium]
MTPPPAAPVNIKYYIPKIQIRAFFTTRRTRIMKNKIRFGLFGCNMYRTRDLMDAAKAAAGAAVEVAACFDIDPAKARHAAEKYGGRAFAAEEEFLACPEVDVVLISLPPYLHADAFARTARAGKDVYLEKPVCVNQAGREKILAAHRQWPVRCYVGLSYRYVTPYRKVAEILRRPDAGRILGVHHHWLAPGRAPVDPSQYGWRQRPEQSGGELLQHCCHVFDWFWWLGGPMDSVTAAAYTPPGAPLPHEEREITAAFLYKNGGMAVFTLSQNSHQYVQRGTVHAEGLGIQYQWGRDTFVRVYKNRARAAEETYEWSLSDEPGDGGEIDRNTAQMKDFIDAWLAGRAMPVGVEDGIRAYDCTCAIRESHRSGRRVDVSGAGGGAFNPGA